MDAYIYTQKQNHRVSMHFCLHSFWFCWLCTTDRITIRSARGVETENHSTATGESQGFWKPTTVELRDSVCSYHAESMATKSNCRCRTFQTLSCTEMTSALLMTICIHSYCWLREIDMIYLQFSFIWDTIKHWCSYPSGNVDRGACLPTVYLPAASSVGSMHQNWVWHDVTFHLQALEPHRYRLCPLLFYALICLSVFTLRFSLFPSPKHIICHLWKLFPSLLPS